MDKINYPTKYFENTKAIHTFIKSDDYSKELPSGGEDKICFGVTFEKSSGSEYSYSLHFDTLKRGGEFEMYPLFNPPVIPFKKESELEWGLARNSGFLLMQHIVDTLILQDKTGDPNAVLKSSVTKVPVKKYSTSNVKDIGESALPLFTTFSLMIIYLRFVYNILREKEAYITENLRNMGMNMFFHYVAWLLWVHITLFISSIPWTIILKLSMLSDINLFIVWAFYFLPGSALICIGFFISAFFTSAKPGVLAALIIFFFMYGAAIGQSSISNLTEVYNGLFSISPLAGISITSSVLLVVQGNFAGFGLLDLFKLNVEYRVIYFIGICIAESWIFMILGMYLDQVIPKSIGVRKHPLFFLGCSTKEAKVVNNLSEVVIKM